MASFKRINLTNCGGQGRTTINDLIPGIMADILSRLPLESILACKLVCIKWYSATRDPCFVKLQLSRSSNRLLLLPVPNKEFEFPRDHLPLINISEGTTRRLPFMKMPFKDFNIKCSYNGLICVSSSNNKADPLVLANPITSERISLPASKGTAKCRLSSYVVSLGCDSSGRYKIARHYRFRRRNRDSRLEILSLGNGSWREINVPSHEWDVCSAVFFNGAFFFMISMKSPWNSWSMGILAIDFQTEELQGIAFPIEFYRPPQLYVEMVELEGCLSVVERDRFFMKVWRIFGDKVGELSLHARYRCNTTVNWGNRLYFRALCRLDIHSFLLWETNWKDDNRDGLILFSPREHIPCLPYKVPELPIRFNTIWIKPSFVSPLVAVLGL